MAGKMMRGLVCALAFMGMVATSGYAGTIVDGIVTGDVDLSNAPADALSTGMIVNPGSKIESGSAATYQVGTTNTTGNLVFNGNNTLDGTNAIIFANQSANQGQMLFQGAGTHTIIGTIDASQQSPTGHGFDLVVNSNLSMDGATLTVDSFEQIAGTIDQTTASTIIAKKEVSVHGNSVYAIDGDFQDKVTFSNGAILKGTGNTIKVANELTMSGSTMDLTQGAVTIDGDVKVNAGSSLIFGADVSTNNHYALTADNVKGRLSDMVHVNQSLTRVLFTQSTVGTIHTAKIINGTLDAQNWATSNVFGDFKFESTGADGLTVNYMKADITDVGDVQRRLASNWEKELITTGTARNTSLIAQQMTAPGSNFETDLKDADIAANLRFNQSFYAALANSDKYFSLSNGDIAILSPINTASFLPATVGANLSGVNYVAQDVARDLNTTLFSRLEAYRAVAVDIGSDTALGSVADVMNDRYLNRIWAAGIGSWTDADKRKGFSGYKYDGKGAMLGYDRAVCAAVFGISAAYIEGDYEDKAAWGHDSEIKNYAATAYMTYNASNGFFMNLSGGWVYSDNDIRENRGGAWSVEDYHTNTWHAEAKFGFDIQPCDNWSISPSVGVNFIHAKANAHDLTVENVAGSVVHYSSAKNHLVEIPVDIQAAYEVALSEVSSVTLTANGGYAYNLNDHAIRGTATATGVGSLDIIGRKLGHHSWKAGAGVKFRYDNWDVGVKYDYLGRDKYQNHRLMGTIGFSF